MNSNFTGQSRNASRREFYRHVRQRTESLCAPLQQEDYVPQAAVFVSPTKWHIAHTTWFFEEFVLVPHLPGYHRFHPDFAFLFNSYYQGIGERTARNLRGLMTRPDVQEIYAYRKYVDEHVDKLLRRQDLAADLSELLNLGLQHEQQHQELILTDIKYTLSVNPMFPVYDPELLLAGSKNDQTGMIVLDEGIYEIGHSGETFCFDNERNNHKVLCQKTTINKALVTNEEYLEFMASGGYTDFTHWLDEGWNWVRENQINAPLYWHFRDGSWFHFSLAGLRPLDPEELLCHINYYEAAAFASWRGMRLLTEFEWEAAQNFFPWGKHWEWTQSAYLPYPGFSRAPGAVGEYNGKFMINQMVLRGASTATPEGHSRKTYRNFFPPELCWQFTGIRMAKP